MNQQVIYMCEKCGYRSTDMKEVEKCEKIHKVEDGIFRSLEFCVTDKHLALLRRVHVGWQRCEYGAPEINPKRPYGNSWVEGDIAEILDIAPEDDEDGEKTFSARQNEEMYVLHLETKVALEIALQTGQFIPGVYVRDTPYGGQWKYKTSASQGQKGR